jgi:hypothetical protein
LAEIAFHYGNGATAALGDGDGRVDEGIRRLMVGVLAFARSAGVGSTFSQWRLPLLSAFPCIAPPPSGRANCGRINSRVQSPRIDELEAIIAGVTTPQPCAHTSDR